ncbi:electron transfer flavoprotein subunit beta/FixA family protein [Paeniglutamicibacter psychrophenolicus]|uniref:electron transfer flavoprotein subunit beta/FixA family protein n=1 Tax=Paeniglutamicibacter psychrophenolicus TaxID=257454 RepID=UPI002781A6E7|nr:electron transfer flavoprotein subunit beta/FixA family protein [Paeniglutamicibacter psychrophenolicus]MDQ0095335.1 electron transfer flavoprotein beta subunit [Paeniglutamicibacter psychrophenolicus]
MSQNTGTPLNILVLVKHVPDVQFERHLTTPGQRLDRSDSVLSELDEYAIEAALALSESRGGDKAGNTVTAMTMGPDAAANAVKKSLQMGAAAGVHISDPALAGSDAGATSLVLATAIKQLGGFDVVLTGMASTDAETSLVPAQLAERLGVAQLTNLSKLEIAPGTTTVTGLRSGEDGTQSVEAALPVLVSVTDQANEPRYPNFRGILAAKKKKVTTLTLAELGLAEGAVGAAGSATRVLEAAPRPPRAAGQVITDSGEAGIALVDFLADAKLI